MEILLGVLSDCEELVGGQSQEMMGLDLVVPNTLISRDSVSWMKPYLKEIFGHTFFWGAYPFP